MLLIIGAKTDEMSLSSGAMKVENRDQPKGNSITCSARPKVTAVTLFTKVIPFAAKFCGPLV